MKKYVFFLMIPVFFSCKEDLSGHWHLRDLEKNISSHASLEILKNNESYIYFSLSSEPSKGEHFPNKKQIAIPSDCGIFMFDYKLKNNQLYLTNALGTNFIATRENNNCNRIKDYKSKLNIDLLKIINGRELYHPIDLIGDERLNQYILLKSKNNNIKLEFFNEINSVDKITSIITHIENTHSDAEIPFINYILTPDKNLKASDLKIVINKLNEGYKKKIFIRTLKVKPEKMNIFEFIKIDEIQLNSDNKLFNIIN